MYNLISRISAFLHKLLLMLITLGYMIEPNVMHLIMTLWNTPYLQKIKAVLDRFL